MNSTRFKTQKDFRGNKSEEQEIKQKCLGDDQKYINQQKSTI